MFVAATGAYKNDPDFFTFPIYLLTKDLTKNFEKKFWGSPYFSPSKKVAQENDPTMAAYTMTPCLIGLRRQFPL